MKSQLKAFKKSLKRSTKQVTRVAHESWSFTKEKSVTGASYAHSQMQKIGMYFKSEAYEVDLDQVIALLHIHKPSSKPNFDKFVGLGGLNSHRDRCDSIGRHSVSNSLFDLLFCSVLFCLGCFGRFRSKRCAVMKRHADLVLTRK